MNIILFLYLKKMDFDIFFLYIDWVFFYNTKFFFITIFKLSIYFAKFGKIHKTDLISEFIIKK